MSSAPTAQAVAQYVKTSGLSPDTLLYRATLAEFLVPDGAGFFISADPDAGEALDNVYVADHVVVAHEVGPGLAFAEDAQDWADEDRTVVTLRLGDVLDQGGAVYPVTSVITATVWYVTLPAGKVSVRARE